MASFYKRARSRYYQIRYLKPDMSWGDRSSGIPVEAEGALRRIREMVKELDAQEAVLRSEGGTAAFRSWVPRWLDHKYGSRAVTRRRYGNAWDHWALFFKLRKITHPAELTYALAHEFVRWRTDRELAEEEGRRACAWNTALYETKVMSAIMQEAVRRGFVVANPCTRLGLMKEPVAEKREITRDEELAIMKKLRAKPQAKWMAEAFLLAMRHGCRLMACRVPMDRVNEEEGTITFVSKGRDHTMPLHDDVRPLVKQAREEGRKVLVDVPSQASVRFQKFFAKGGYEKLTFHSTRVTVVTRLCRAGYSESQTMAYVGHASALVHAIYRKLKAPDVAHLGEALR